MKYLLAAMLGLWAAALAGCGAAPPEAKPAPAPQASAPLAPPPPAAVKAASEKPAPRPEKRERPAAERAKVAQLFQVPQFNRAANAGNYNDAKQEGAAPHIRLLGFSRVDGHLTALVQVKAEILSIEPGDVIDGAEVVSVDAEGASFQYAGQRWTSRLFEKTDVQQVTVARAGVSAAAAAPQGGVESAAPAVRSDEPGN